MLSSMSTTTMLGRSSSSREGLAEDDGSIANQSTVSIFSTNFKANFEWLFPSAAALSSSGGGGSSSRAAAAGTISDRQWKEKEDLICAVLDGSCDGGVGGDAVDLWKLRELALTPGGLLCPALRRQAWPKLVGSHEQVLQVAHSGGTGSTTVTGRIVDQNLVTPSPEDTNALKRDVSNTMWQIEEYLVASREQERVQQERLEHFLALQRQRNNKKKVTFSPHTKVPPEMDLSGMDAAEDGEQNDRASPPSVTIVSPTSDDGLPVEEEETSVLSDDHGAMSEATANSALSTSFSFCGGGLVDRWRKASIHEQKILYNIILSVLRTEAEPSEFFEDDRYHYYSGLQDLTALLMINLESPSLTSLLLTKLAGSHLRDALRKDRVMMDMAISKAFMPLLQKVDAGLYRHLQRNDMARPSFAHQWIACWFAQDVPDVAVASRLVDAFLVSHPLMPMYVSVAMLSRHREHIINNDCHVSMMYSMLREMPVQHVFEQDNRMGVVEDLIATAVSYMKRVPPTDLVESLQKQFPESSAVLPSVAMFASAPEWSTANEAPTDYALLKRAKMIRCEALFRELQEFEETEEEEEEDGDDKSTSSDGEELTEESESSETSTTEAFTVFQEHIYESDRMFIIRRNYPLAAAAVGCARRRGLGSYKKPITVLVFAFTVLVAILVWTGSMPSSSLSMVSIWPSSQVSQAPIPPPRHPRFAASKKFLEDATRHSMAVVKSQVSKVKIPPSRDPRLASNAKFLEDATRRGVTVIKTTNRSLQKQQYVNFRSATLLGARTNSLAVVVVKPQQVQEASTSANSVPFPYPSLLVVKSPLADARDLKNVVDAIRAQSEKLSSASNIVASRAMRSLSGRAKVLEEAASVAASRALRSLSGRAKALEAASRVQLGRFGRWRKNVVDRVLSSNKKL